VEHFAVTDDRVQRRAQFVADVGQEARLGGIRLVADCFASCSSSMARRSLSDMVLKAVARSPSSPSSSMSSMR
jgi:hypothetical protein